MTATRLVLALLALASPALSQRSLFPGGDLQFAIDNTPDGGYVLIYGGEYEHVQIVDKSIALLGVVPFFVHHWREPLAPAPSLADPPSMNIRPGPVEAKGRPGDWLIIWNGVLGYQDNLGWSSYSNAGAGLYVDGYQELWVSNSIIFGVDPRFDGYAQGRPAIHAVGVQVVIAENSYLQASTAAAPDLWTSSGVPNGAAGIQAHGAAVLSMRSYIQGGGHETWGMYFPSSSPCPCPNAGAVGGNAVEAASFINGGIAEPGRGARVLWVDPSGNWVRSWGRQPPGLPFVQR